MRCLGIDYGTKRIGLSYGDELGVATPLPALIEADPGRRWRALAAVLQQREVTEIVVGHPLNMDDTAGPKAREAEAFAARLREDRLVARPPAAADRTAAAMEQAQRHATFARDFMQRAMRFPYLPCAGDHAAVLV